MPTSLLGGTTPEKTAADPQDPIRLQATADLAALQKDTMAKQSDLLGDPKERERRSAEMLRLSRVATGTPEPAPEVPPGIAEVRSMSPDEAKTMLASLKWKPDAPLHKALMNDSDPLHAEALQVWQELLGVAHGHDPIPSLTAVTEARLAGKL